TPVTDRDDRSGREAPRRRVRSHFARARGWAASYARMSWSVPTCAYRCVVDSRLWPRSSWIIRRSAPASSRCVANVWRRVWGVRRRGAAGGDDALRAALAEHPHRLPGAVDVVEVETGQLGDAEPAGVEKLEHGGIAQALGAGGRLAGHHAPPPAARAGRA